jgi:hypothetical protein
VCGCMVSVRDGEGFIKKHVFERGVYVCQYEVESARMECVYGMWTCCACRTDGVCEGATADRVAGFNVSMHSCVFVCEDESA